MLDSRGMRLGYSVGAPARGSMRKGAAQVVREKRGSGRLRAIADFRTCGSRLRVRATACRRNAALEDGLQAEETRSGRCSIWERGGDAIGSRDEARRTASGLGRLAARVRRLEDAKSGGSDGCRSARLFCDDVDGGGNVKSPLELSEKEWDDTMATNLKGQWLVSKYVCILMNKANRGGSIINISSISGLDRALQRGALAYITSKAALNTLTKVMAMELGEHNIRVNCICPGLFKSEITKDLMEKDWIKNVARRMNPLGTFGTSNPALTTTIRYLVHDSSKYVSGNIFIVDSGNSLLGVPIFSSL
ncbi:3-oxoacyl-(acyl-carrier-protein) reductase FabG-like isoform X2 [Cucumis melo var. makuwa]|uniref:3-oxoacyl-(Acyl-carrier-protein) reductase FabG-like isoform X2 n=1 Tax=Cucumis melo var. makuwa TaxID=1194695 RepID=A0A5D3DVU8_CUCMM|nr:3-oxoacyl-(acyl-carrier-protein) reductase FabG-like isoform X2 [Cucumis melo var. makuwa]